MVDSIHHYDLSGLGAAEVETAPQFDKAPLEDIARHDFPGRSPKSKTKFRSR